MKRTDGSILIVDDNEDDRLFMSRALARTAPDLLAHYAASGHEAVAYLEGQGPYGDRALYPFPAFIITDCEMPDGDGFSVLKALQQNLRGQSSPVMMLSTSDDPSDVRRAYQLGATSYCVKPCDSAALCTLLKAFLAKSPAVNGSQRNQDVAWLSSPPAAPWARRNDVSSGSLHCR